MAKVKQQDEATPEIENAETVDTVEVSEEITEPTDTVEGTTEAKAEQPTVLYTDLSEDDRIAKLKETADKISMKFIKDSEAADADTPDENEVEDLDDLDYLEKLVDEANEGEGGNNTDE
ncbi:MAG: hypothetical protein FWC34_00250 [Bacteroidetes bacterium]|nr:hypothetical protein [Bacteroidota bacterium]